ncbi:peptide synthetase [Streptomyces rubiginosohelvolus]|uniref:peptide synthetase n=1 Tax=Streptomyces rubiginosohelvolus TaxID=67362 RepID=UPI0036FF8D7B
MPTSHDEGAMRELGAFERTIDLYMHRNPVQFSLVAEFDREVSEPALVRALGRVQKRHPLLRVSVDRRGRRARYRRAEGRISVESAAAGTPWQAIVADEQTRPIAPEPGPLARAVLVPGETGSVVVVTFAHQITDGSGAVRVLTDLVTALDGGGASEEEPSWHVVPPCQEDLLSALDTTRAEIDTPQESHADAPGELTPFSARTPHVSSLALPDGLTARLVGRCRDENVSVHAALCAAACTVFHREGRDRVRVLSPVDLRRAAGLPDGVANRFAGARTVSEKAEAGDFWGLARRHHRALERQRTPYVLKAGAQALVQQPPTTPEEAEAMMAAVTAADIQITNLGAVETSANGRSGPVAVWGPAQTTQLRGEHVLGVVTVGGRLRMTELTHDPVAVLLPAMASVLAQQCAASGTPS